MKKLLSIIIMSFTLNMQTSYSESHLEDILSNEDIDIGVALWTAPCKECPDKRTTRERIIDMRKKLEKQNEEMLRLKLLQKEEELINK